MSVITVSSSMTEVGEDIGRAVADSLEYRFLDERELIRAASKQHEAPEEELVQALEDSSPLLGSSIGFRKQNLARVQATLTRYLLDDDIVYAGPLGHLLIRGVSHVLKVWIDVSIEDRIRRLKDVEGVSSRKATKIITHREKNHQRWVKEIFKTDDPVPSSFDLVINMDRVVPEEACELILKKVKARRFKAMTYSRNQLADLELGARLRAKLIDLDPDISVEASHGKVTIKTRAYGKAKEKNVNFIRERIAGVEGVSAFTVDVIEDVFKRIVRRMG